MSLPNNKPPYLTFSFVCIKSRLFLCIETFYYMEDNEKVVPWVRGDARYDGTCQCNVKYTHKSNMTQATLLQISNTVM